MHAIGRLAASFTLLAVSAGIALAADDGRRIETVENGDYFGFDLRAEQNVSLKQCKALCLDDRQCRAFTYNRDAQWCFLKSDYSRLAPYQGAVAGRVIEADDDAIGAPAPLPFVPPYIGEEADRYAARLTRDSGAENVGINALSNAADRALAAGDARRAMALYAQSLQGAGETFALWSGLARAVLGIDPEKDDEKYRLPQLATSAALNAYRRSRTAHDRATALALLAEGLEARSLSRPALEAYKASLALENSAVVQADYADLRARKGFRVVDHSVDSDAATPRICIQFSEALIRTGLDYASYVTVDGAAPDAVEARDKQVCVEGLRHGQRYRIALRNGLPAAIGEALQQPVALNIYVRDRSPALRFTGDNFVLPSTGRRGIPLISVNTQEAELALYRVGERGLTQLLSGSYFLRQLDGYRASQIANDIGAAVWEGALDIATEQNADVTTSIPVDELVPEMKPGLYVLTAIPAGARNRSWAARATQWFVVSDIGLVTYAGQDGLNVYARSLGTAKPLADVKLELLARNNEILGTATTGKDGMAAFAPGLTRGDDGMAPAVLVARGEDSDFVILDLTRPGFDLSDRGVAGRPAPGALDVFAWTERGIYRAGETVHVGALARDTEANAVTSLPLTFIFRRPDGVEARRTVSDGDKLGGHAVALDLQNNAMRGTWQVRVHTDPDSEPVTEQMFLVEDFVPDRIEFDLTAAAPAIRVNNPVSVAIDGRYLYGAPAAGLGLEGEIDLSTVREWPNFAGFVFGLADEEKISRRIALGSLPNLDDDGQARFDVRLDDTPSTTQLLNAAVVVRVREAGGRAVERSVDIPVAPSGAMIGIRPEFKDNQVAEGSNAAFRVIVAGPEGQRRDAQDLRWSLQKLERRYQWYRDGGAWRYEPVTYSRQIADGKIDVTAADAGRIEVPVAWGRYRLEVETGAAGGPVSSLEFNAGWYVESASTETPDGLEIALDQESYRPGDVARLTVSPRFAGELLVTIGADRLLETQTVSVPESGATIDIPIGDGWGAGAYVTATLFRPGNGETSRMPMRAIGVKWLQIDPGRHALQVAMEPPQQTKPHTPLDIPVTVSGLRPGEDAYVMVAAVDVGILNLTSYEPPAPDDWYFGQRRMGIEIRDLYGRLIDGSLGATGRIRSGGDGAMMTAEGSPPTEELVSFFSGPVRVDDSGRVSVRFELPQFNGTVRVMAVVWSAKAVGHGVSDVIVRDPVVVSAGLPKFMAPGDRARIRLDFANTDGPAGDYALEVVTDGGISTAKGTVPETITLAQGARQAVTLPLMAQRATAGTITVRLNRDDGVAIEQVFQVPVRPATMPVTRRQLLTLAPLSGSVILDRDFLAGSKVEGASVSIGVTHGVSLDVPALLMALERYPYGCAEQTTSGALPLLYLSEMSTAAGIAEHPANRGRVQKAIRRILSFQSSTGGFGLWRPGSGDLWLDSYIADFLTRAREQNYAVPEQAMMRALDNLQNTLAYTSDLEESGGEIAYALYVLARNRRASAGDLRYYADTQLDQFASPMARAQIGASLALYGDSVRAEKAFASAYSLASGKPRIGLSRADYGSSLRDNAAMLALAAETSPAPSQLNDMRQLVATAKQNSGTTSTQENAWLLLAARAIRESDEDISLEINGGMHQGNFAYVLDGEIFAAVPIKITNRGEQPVEASVTIQAVPEKPLPAGGDGFTISRTYYRLDGQEANITEARQNERYVAVIRIREENAWPSRVAVTDLLPAGFEIDNPRIVGSSDMKNFPWLERTDAVHTEFRNDRFVAAFDRTANSSRDITLAYVVRAVTPGTYALPAAYVEDMYRPQYSARTATGRMEVRGLAQ